MATVVRPLESDDLALLEPIDRAYAATVGVEPIVARAGLNFYARSGHAFVAVREGRASGFVLAHAVWNGDRPAVAVARVAVADPDDRRGREALLEAVTKSAYDAAVYDLVVEHPVADEEGARALAAKLYRERPVRLYGRTLGSRGRES